MRSAPPVQISHKNRFITDLSGVFNKGCKWCLCKAHTNTCMQVMWLKLRVWTQCNSKKTKPRHSSRLPTNSHQSHGECGSVRKSCWQTDGELRASLSYPFLKGRILEIAAWSLDWRQETIHKLLPTIFVSLSMHPPFIRLHLLESLQTGQRQWLGWLVGWLVS